MLAWIFGLLIGAVIVANGSFVLRWALPGDVASNSTGRIALYVCAGIILLFFVSCFTSLWKQASTNVMLPLLFGMGILSCFCVGWGKKFSRYRSLNSVLSGLAFLTGMCFFCVAIIALLFVH
jgi:protein-S-isoprenylcysteine O-methyltransferase Ste14